MTESDFRGASVRAAFCHSMLRAVAEQPAEQRAAIEQSLGAATLGRIERASGVGWVDASDSLALLEAVHTVLGDDGTRAIGSRALIGVVRRPILSFVPPAFRQAGREVMLTLFPRAWSFMLKGHGWTRIEQAEHHLAWTRVAILDLPLSMATSPAFHRGVQGVLEGLMTTVGLHPDVELDASGASKNMLVFTMHGTPP